MGMMLPPDLGAMMGGGAPAPGPEAGGIPPDLAALMGGGAPVEEEAPPSITDGTPGGGSESLVIALDALQDAIDADTDQEDIQIMLQCQAKLQGILAKDQAAADSAMGGNLPPKAARKMAGSLGA